MRTWVGACASIGLDAIGEIDVLQEILGHVAITPQVAEEVFTGRESLALQNSRGTWIDVVDVRGDLHRFTSIGLGTGEASLLLTPAGDHLILDEIPARTVAEAEGREYIGLLGLLLAGVDRGAITAVRARGVLHKLAQGSFRMTSDLYDGVLRALDGRR